MYIYIYVYVVASLLKINQEGFGTLLSQCQCQCQCPDPWITKNGCKLIVLLLPSGNLTNVNIEKKSVSWGAIIKVARGHRFHGYVHFPGYVPLHPVKSKYIPLNPIKESYSIYIIKSIGSNQFLSFLSSIYPTIKSLYPSRIQSSCILWFPKS